MDISFDATDVRIEPYSNRYITINAEIAYNDGYNLAIGILSRLESEDRQNLLEKFEEDIRNLGFIKQE